MLSHRHVSTDLFHIGEGTDVFGPTDQSDGEINQPFAITETWEQTREQNNAFLVANTCRIAPKVWRQS